jgi:hypothetical protein
MDNNIKVGSTVMIKDSIKGTATRAIIEELEKDYVLLHLIRDNERLTIDNPDSRISLLFENNYLRIKIVEQMSKMNIELRTGEIEKIITGFLSLYDLSDEKIKQAIIDFMEANDFII